MKQYLTEAQARMLRNMSDSEISLLVLELSQKFPQYKEWQWFNIVHNLRKFGMLEHPPPAQESVTEQTKKKQTTAALWAVFGVLVFYFLTTRRR